MKFWFGQRGWGWRLWGMSYGDQWFIGLSIKQPAAHPAITHCDNCGCDWLDNGLNPVGCPYCKQNAWRAAFVAERAVRYCEGGMAIEQARIHAETGATLMEHAARQQPAAVDEGASETGNQGGLEHG